MIFCELLKLLLSPTQFLNHLVPQNKNHCKCRDLQKPAQKADGGEGCDGCDGSDSCDGNYGCEGCEGCDGHLCLVTAA